MWVKDTHVNYRFVVGALYRVYDFSKNQYLTSKVIDRTDRRVTVSIEGKSHTSEIYYITTPRSEALNINGYSTIYANDTV